MRRIILPVLFMVFFCAFPIYAEITLKAEVDKKKMTTDEVLTYKVVVASTQKALPAVELPEFEGFRLLSQANSSSISFVKGEAKTILVYACVLAPQEKGKFTVGPSIIKIKDSVISSESFEIEVAQGKNRPPEKTQPQPRKEEVTL